MNNLDSNIVVVIPTFNEEKGIGPTILELREILGRGYYIIVDGKSTDKTVEIAKSMSTNILMQEGIGKGNAMAKAIRNLPKISKYTIFIDADFTYPAKYIPKMLRLMSENPHIGMVIGNRFNEIYAIEESINNIFYLGNRIIALVHFLVNKISLNDPLSGLRIVRSKILENWRPKSEGFDIEVELNHFVKKSGFEIIEIPIQYRKRLGEKKLKLSHGIRILKRILLQM